MFRFAPIALLLPAVSLPQSVPMFRGNLRHTGVYDAPGVRSAPKVKWKFQTGARVISSPAIAGGAIYFGSVDQHVYALDLQSGRQKWKFKTESAVTSSPAVSGGAVYFGSFDGNFYALDAANGKLKWKFATEGERRFTAKGIHGLHPRGESMPDPWDFYLSSPAVTGGVVYVGSGDGNIYALNAATGALKWKARTGDVVHSSPAVAGGIVYAGSWDSFLYALDAATGRQVWRYKTGEDPKNHNQVGIQSSPVVVDGAVYFGCRDSKVYAVGAVTGKRKWEFTNDGSWVLNTPAVDEGKLYFGTSDTARFYVLNAATGSPLFQWDARMPIYASPTIAGGIVYIGTFGGKLYALDIKTRRELWVWQSEASKRNAVKFTGRDGRLDFMAAMGSNFYEEMVTAVGRMFTMGSILSSPVVDGNVVYFGSTDGALYALM
jgi:outer membrane protein assembly factor BamB